MVNRDQRGFTLIELMVVVVILGILAGLIIPKIMGRPEEAKRLKARMQIEQLEQSLKLYCLDNGTYPTTEQGLVALVEKPGSEPVPKRWREGGYLEKSKVPLDPWGNPFVYSSPGVHSKDFDLVSYGADGEQGGEGKYADIESWNLE
jgi:general secretion pathway protein G